MPSSLGFLSSLTKRETVILIVALIAILGALWLGYSLYQERGPSVEESVAQQAAEDVAQAENPFRGDNPLVDVETNPFDKAKKVLNPFEQ